MEQVVDSAYKAIQVIQLKGTGLCAILAGSITKTLRQGGPNFHHDKGFYRIKEDVFLGLPRIVRQKRISDARKGADS